MRLDSTYCAIGLDGIGDALELASGSLKTCSTPHQQIYIRSPVSFEAARLKPLDGE